MSFSDKWFIEEQYIVSRAYRQSIISKNDKIGPRLASSQAKPGNPKRLPLDVLHCPVEIAAAASIHEFAAPIDFFQRVGTQRGTSLSTYALCLDFPSFPANSAPVLPQVRLRQFRPRQLVQGIGPA
ncbi:MULTISPECIES: hypothetical protein [unclassified Sphingopyxis]|jgi:hypothetical protein|uniref:hypothetical protein n=1 Tax=unclassified Sphingopyxis TaxID=2614943 RepID=UPI0025D41858|nr:MULTISPECIES: hypothetical protein [unclassified Sphingopyxis]